MVKLKADLHNHLRTGSYMPPRIFNRTVDVASERLGPGGIVGLVNYEDYRFENFYNHAGNRGNYPCTTSGNSLYFPQQDILIVKGQEVPTTSGDLLVLGVGIGGRLKAGRKVEDAIKEARDMQGIPILDHPFFNAGTLYGLDIRKKVKLACLVDGIEVHNGIAGMEIPGITREIANIEAQEFYTTLHFLLESLRRVDSFRGRLQDLRGLDLEDLIPDAFKPWASMVDVRNVGVGALASSDGHSLRELGRSYTQLDMPEYPSIKNAEELNKHLRTAVRSSRIGGLHCEDSKLGALRHMALLVPCLIGRKIDEFVDFGLEKLAWRLG